MDKSNTRVLTVPFIKQLGPSNLIEYFVHRWLKYLNMPLWSYIFMVKLWLLKHKIQEDSLFDFICSCMHRSSKRTI